MSSSQCGVHWVIFKTWDKIKWKSYMKLLILRKWWIIYMTSYELETTALISNVIHSTPFCFSCGFYLWSKSSFKYFSVHLLVVGATKYRCRHGDLQMWQPAEADTPLDTQRGSGKHSTISKCLFFSEMKYIFLASLPPKCSPKMLVLCLLHFFWWFKKSLLHFTAFENTFGNVLEKLSSARARGILDTG